MENLIKGYITSLFGLIGAILTIAHWTGYLVLPNPKALDNDYECTISLLASLVLFRLPKNKLDEWIEKFLQGLSDRFIGKKDEK